VGIGGILAAFARHVSLFPAPSHDVDITESADRKKAAPYAHASLSPEFYYGLQDTVATFRGLQSSDLWDE
jgi:hypothetical protein